MEYVALIKLSLSRIRTSLSQCRPSPRIIQKNRLAQPNPVSYKFTAHTANCQLPYLAHIPLDDTVPEVWESTLQNQAVGSFQFNFQF